MAKVVLELTTPTTLTVTWRIRNFSKLKKTKVYSDAFAADGSQWRILVFPKGNKVEYFSIYLAAAVSSTLPHGWSSHLQFSFTVVDQIYNKLSITEETEHLFNATESDWGFASYMPLKDLLHPGKGYLVNDSVVVQVKIALRQALDHLPNDSEKGILDADRQKVHFRALARPKKIDFCLELSKLHTYDDVVERVAGQIGLDDPSKIRLTSHNSYSQLPMPQPIKYRGVERLSDMLVLSNQTYDILYYEVLDIPLPDLEDFTTLKVAYHHGIEYEVEIHTIRLPKQSTIGDLIHELKKKVELSHPNAELRVLQIFYHEIYKILTQDEKVEQINDQYWTLRAEEIPDEDKNLGPHDHLICIHHFTRELLQNQMKVRNFGEPFLLVIHEGETLAEVKVRVQKRLQVPNEEFAKWKFASLTLGSPEYLKDSDVVFSHFQGRNVYGASNQYLGLEHSDKTPNQSYATNQNPPPPHAFSAGGTGSSMSAQSSSGVKIISKNLTGEPLSTNSGPDPNPNTLQHQREALQYYLKLSLEAVEEANACNEIEKIALLIRQQSTNSLERTILKNLILQLEKFKGIVPETRSMIQNVREQRKILQEKNRNLGARLDQGREQLDSLVAKREKLKAEEAEMEAEIKRLTLQKEELVAGVASVNLLLDKVNEQVSKDLEERRELDKETEEADDIWLRTRETLAQANLTWKLYEQNLKLFHI